MIRILIIATTLSACGALRRKSVATPSANPRVGELRTAYTSNLTALRATADQTSGWPSAADCDSTLWAGEAAAVGDDSVKLELAAGAPGEIHRRPAASGECYPNESSSTVSRDMIIGYISGMYARKDRVALEQLADYGDGHAWVMGTGPASQTFFTPDGQGLLARAIEALGGAARPQALVPATCLPVAEDYEIHIQTLGALLDAAATGGTDELCVDRLAANAAAAPKDALLQAATGVFTGDMTAATDLLLDPTYACPSYVRGAPTYCAVHRLYAAHVVLTHSKDQ